MFNQNIQNKPAYKWDLEKLRRLAQKVYEDEQEMKEIELKQEKCLTAQ